MVVSYLENFLLFDQVKETQLSAKARLSVPQLTSAKKREMW